MFGVKRKPSRTPLIHYSDLPVIWRLCCSAPLDGPDNMALDAALMQRARRTGETVLRVYGWRRPTLSFGRNQRAAGAYDVQRIAQAGLDVVRRPTGGRALLHHHEITYSVTAPATDTLRRAYADINALLINALGALGVPASEFRTSGRSLAPGVAPCFAEPSAGELVSGGRKLVGSAQWRDAGAMLQHGSLLVDDDQSSIASLLTGAPVAPVPPPATLRGLMGRAPAMEEVAAVLGEAVRRLADPAASWFEPEPEVGDDARRLADRFRDAAWTWRR